MENEAIAQTVDQVVQETVSQPLLIQGGITSAVIIAVLIAMRFALVHFVKGGTKILNKDQRRWINRINNGTSIAVVIALILIWAPQLHTFALSLTAVAVAVVLTTKELLMCLTGGFLRASTGSFDIGDWITVEGITGEVMRITAMTTTIEKIDVKGLSYQYTGESVQIPNSRFLTVNVENANFVKNYIYHEFSVTVQHNDIDPNRMMAKIEEITRACYAPLRDDAAAFNRRIEMKAAFDFADPEPQFFLKTNDTGLKVISIRLFLPTRAAFATATEITRKFLTFVYEEREKQKQDNGETG